MNWAFSAIQVVETVVRRDADAERPWMGSPRVLDTCIALNAIRSKYAEVITKKLIYQNLGGSCFKQLFGFSLLFAIPLIKHLR